MIHLRLTRETMTATYCRGVLEALDERGELRSRLFTIERPWIPDSDGGLAGENSRSCIGEGIYTVDAFVRPNGDRVWIVSNPALDVFKFEADISAARLGKGRCLILIHAANRASEVEGCIAPGRNWTTDDGESIVTNSRLAIADLHAILDGQSDIELVISRPVAGSSFGTPYSGRPRSRVRAKQSGASKSKSKKKSPGRKK